MKILHLISSGGMYGAEAVILDLSRTLQRMGHQSVLGVFVNSSSPNTELEQRARTYGIRTYALPCRGKLDLAVSDRIRALVQLTDVDIVHAHGYKADIYAWWSLRRSAAPLVSTCHNWLDNDLSLRVYGALDRLVLRQFTRVVAVSDGVRQRLLDSDVRPDKIALIRNGVDIHSFAGASRFRALGDGRPLTVGIVARLSPEKGVDLFLKAAALIKEEFPAAKFLIAGDGPERFALQSLLEQLGLSHCVRLIGRQENMGKFYSSLDLLVLSSRTEGLPMALLEGMANELPVVATAVGQVPQVIDNDSVGRIVPGDPAALARAITELLRDAPLRERIGKAARAHVSAEFSADRMATDYLHMYEQTMQEKSS